MKSEEYKPIDIRCPDCNSERVVLCKDPQGHYQVVQCHNCNYKKECKL